MNYLAHAYLSFSDNEILAGNMISDFVKGKTRYDYPAGIQEGITLHREIDRFTDDHPAVKKKQKKYSGLHTGFTAAPLLMWFLITFLLSMNPCLEKNPWKNLQKRLTKSWPCFLLTFLKNSQQCFLI